MDSFLESFLNEWEVKFNLFYEIVIEHNARDSDQDAGSGGNEGLSDARHNISITSGLINREGAEGPNDADYSAEQADKGRDGAEGGEAMEAFFKFSEFLIETSISALEEIILIIIGMLEDKLINRDEGAFDREPKPFKQFRINGSRGVIDAAVIKALFNAEGEAVDIFFFNTLESDILFDHSFEGIDRAEGKDNDSKATFHQIEIRSIIHYIPQR